MFVFILLFSAALLYTAAVTYYVSWWLACRAICRYLSEPCQIGIRVLRRPGNSNSCMAATSAQTSKPAFLTLRLIDGLLRSVLLSFCVDISSCLCTRTLTYKSNQQPWKAACQYSFGRIGRLTACLRLWLVVMHGYVRYSVNAARE